MTFLSAPIRPFFDIGYYADGLVPVLAVPEHEIPNGARAG
jgi:hypothetical protein